MNLAQRKARLERLGEWAAVHFHSGEWYCYNSRTREFRRDSNGEVVKTRCGPAITLAEALNTVEGF